MDKFVQFEPPSPAVEKKGFFARLFGPKGEDTPSNPTPAPRPTAQPLNLSATIPANPRTSPEQVSPRSLAQAKANNTILVNPTLTAQNDNRARNNSAAPSNSAPQPVRTTAVNVQPTLSKEIPQVPKIVRNPKTVERRVQNKPSGLSSGEIGMLDKLRMRRNDKNQKEFWMRDESVTNCYNCQVPFGVLVRKHHCRLCGQIFCHKCTENNVPGELLGYTKNAVRVCNFCFHILQNPNLCEEVKPKTQLATTPNLSSSGEFRRINDPLNSPRDESLSNINNINNNNSLIDELADPQEEELLSRTYTRIAFSGYHLLGDRESDASSPAAIIPVRDDMNLGTSPDDFNFTHVRSDSRLLTDHLTGEDRLYMSSPESGFGSLTNPSGHYFDKPSPVFDSMLSPPSEVPYLHQLGGHVDVRTVDQFLSKKAGTPRADKTIKYRNRMSRARIDLDDMVQAFKTMFNPSDGSAAGTIDTTEEHHEKLIVQKFYHKLEKEFDLHLLRLTRELVEREGLDSSWINIIIHLARSACNSVKPHVRDGDAIDIRRYIKIKKIEGGQQSDCQSVDGVVFTKNRTNKRMKSEFTEPKILLLNCALEYERNARLSSFDSLLAQEKEYLRILVHKVASVRPDIVFVAKNVSRLAQDFMLEENVCLELNLKPNLMHIIARITRGDLLASTEHVRSAQLGTCGRFRIEACKLPDGSIKPCTYIESCPRDLFCTLVLRGDRDEILSKVKKVLHFVCYAVYDTNLELKLIADTYIDENTSTVETPSADQNEKKTTTEVKYIEDRCLSTSPNVKFVHQVPKQAKDPNAAGPAVPAVYPILRRRPTEPNLYTCSQSHLINNIINNIMLSNDYNSSYTSYEPIYTKDADESMIDSSYRDYYNSTSDKNKGKAARSDASNAATPMPTSEVRTISRRNPFGIEFNYRCVLAAIEQQYNLPPLCERRIDSTQYILYLHSLFCHKTSSNCIPQELHYLDYYSSNDLTLGQFLEYYCFNTKLTCRARDCNRDMLDHERSFFHYKGRLNISVKNWRLLDKSPLRDINMLNDQIYVWQQCKVCKMSSHQVVPLAEESWRYSFGKYLENTFYGESPKCSACKSSIWRDYMKYFYYNDTMVIFEYESITLMDVVVPSLKPLACADEYISSLRTREIANIQREILITYEEIGLKLAQLRDSAGKLIEPVDQREVAEELDQLYEMSARESGMFAERIDELSNKTGARDSFDVNACKKVLLSHTVTWLSTLTEVEGKIQRRLMRPLMKPAAKKEPGQTSPQPAPKEAVAPLSGLHHSLSTSDTIKSDKGAQDKSLTVSQQLPQSAAVAKEVHDLDFDRQSHVILRKHHRRSTSMPGGIVRDLIHFKSENSAITEEIEGSPPTNQPVTLPNSEPVPVPTLVLEQPTDGTNSISAAPNSANTLATVGSALGSSVLSQNSPSTESNTPQLALSNNSVAKPTDEKGPVGKRLLDTISNIFAADKKTFTVLEDVTAHYFLPPCIDNIVLPIYETEISSFVAYTLMSPQYQQSVSDLTAKELNKDAAGVNVGVQSVPAAVASNNTNVNNVDQSSEGVPKDAASTGNDVSKSGTGKDTTSVPANEDPNKERDEILKGLTTSFNSTVDCNFKQDYRAGQTIKVKLKTTVYFAQHFEWLRRLIGVDESQFIASMSRSKIWDAKGGKSRSWFSKTLDDRWILKGIAAVELESFLQFAPQYFDYLSKVYFQQVPTALAKIVGVYSVIYKRGNKSLKQDFLVMENLFYKRSISKIYDLKGSLRSRYVNVEEEKAEGPVVLLDENLLETIYSNPICVREESKATLGMTIWNDTLFLSSLNVMDYSLLVGVDEEKNELVVGIIDYMRRYTWDKQLETWVKRTGFLGDGNKVPTIISPKQYKKRFRSALWLYFPMVPTKDTSVVSFSAQK